MLLHRPQRLRVVVVAPLLRWRLRLPHLSLRLKQAGVVVAARLIHLLHLQNRRPSQLQM